ncbi:MAG TPA: DUF1489 domain-containing protein [Sphingomonas sp.]
MTLHLTKVAVGCAEIETLRARLDSRGGSDETFVTTRYRPKRADEVIGGSLYWIIKHQLVARQTILGFEDEPEGRRIRILLAADLVAVRPRPRRAHQGWRYLPGADAPADLDGEEADGLAELPPRIAAELFALALI